MNLTIFYSWQMTTDKSFNKYFIKKCIEKSVSNIENKGQLKDVFLKIEESTSNIPGSPDIPAIIEQRIKDCDIFIGDLTIVNSYTPIEKFLRKFSKKDMQYFINNNVYGEYSRALAELDYTQVISVMNTAYGNPDNDPYLIPFDTKHRRNPITYILSKKKNIDKIQNDLSKVLESAIRLSALAAIEKSNSIYKPFIRFSEHSKDPKNQERFFENDFILDVKNKISENKKNIRILGLSGLGKTRIVFEAFKEPEDFRLCYLYCDAYLYESSSIQAALEEIIKNKEKAYIVIDNCDEELFNKALLIKNKSQAQIPLLTIYNQPEEFESDKCFYIRIPKSMDDIVDAILKKDAINLKEDVLPLVKEFSGGIPLMAKLLVKSINEGEEYIGRLKNEDLVSKLLKTEKNSNERRILQSCSIFDFIGIEDEVRDQIKFVATNKNITPINGEDVVIISQFDEVILKYSKREIFEKKGRLVSIRPKTLALFLAAEWFENCNSEKLRNLFNDVQTQSNAKILIESLCNQIQYLGYNKKAKTLFEKLLELNGPFDNAEVLNTELGSRLFRSFVEVNPIAVANNLYRLFGSMSIDQLKKVEEGRRNLVWTVEKLCFDENTFEKGAKLMMSFAAAEIETWGNNATGEFLHLFKIHLSGTQANYDERLKIINWGSTKDDYIELSIKAIDSSLEASHFYYTSGAEFQGTKKLEQYIPKTWDEIFKYWDKSLDILLNIIKIKPEYSKIAYEILANKVGGLCSVNACHIILPKIKDAIRLKNNDWDDMLDALYNIKIFDFDKISTETQIEILEIINSLTKVDFVSRFLEVRKNRNQDFENYSFEEDIKYRQEQYRELAMEFVEKELYSNENLEKIFIDKESFSIPFGFTVAELINDNIEKRDLFIKNCIEVIGEFNEYDFNPSIILDFVRGLNEDGTKLFIDSLTIHDNLKYLLFPVFAIRKSSFDCLDELFKLVEEQKVSLLHFRNFFNYYPDLASVPEGKISDVFSRILNFGDEGFELIMTLSHNMLYFKSKASEFNRLKDFVESAITGFPLIDAQKKGRDIYYQNIILLLKDKNRSALAKYINSEIIKLAKDISISFALNYDVEKLYKILIESYFNDIWVDLSKALLSENEDYFIYYHLKSLLGSHIGGVGREVGLLFLGNTDVIFTWCTENPEKAPERLAGMVPIYEGENFHPYAKRLIDEFGNNQTVLNSLSSTMGTFSWTGSVIPLYLRKRKLFESILDHPIPEVKEWAHKYISYTDADIKREKQSEEERRFLYS